MSTRQKLGRSLDRLLLGAMMAAVAFAMEQALNRMVAAKPDEPAPRSRLGQSVFQRLMPGMSAQLRHHHPHAAPPAKSSQ